MSTASNPQPRLTEAQIDRAIAAATAGHRMAGMEPTAADIAIGRRQLRGEITGDEAVELALAAALNERKGRP
ncbi:hypothetical protein EEB12_15505 [Rhodococcus sp. WS1]|uniref:antitoxin VbhA family protein n=1 Tax=unclassified Rhodococcus (in: high G+C Gram-positive bacteria) TaxID=192944 RepID=UPI00114114B2|nr:MULTISPECIES: antitoxin VbhA family protein [unclassified Rhodococcus (in: high G+C Gram-positive bacteria)]ROZ55227.1 hypothetical protein EEB12_15505 [Rhodococcus sp. WS1]TQC37788.1 hypothetical protein EEB16_11920 [Rhodococcus sp. WS7]